MNNENECDIVHNMCGWFIQFVENNHTYRTQIPRVTTELQACLAAQDMGFNRMAVWDYERHVKDVVIPKATNGKMEGYNNNGNGNGMHLRARSLQGGTQCQGMPVTRPNFVNS